MATQIQAAGAVLWRPAGANPDQDTAAAETAVEIALVHRPRYDDWSLPKGKLKPGETIWAAAAREVAEETGFPAVLRRHLCRVDYPVTEPVRGHKTVDFVSARARPGRFQPNREVDALVWLPPGEAAAVLSYDTDARVLQEFRRLPANTTTVLLVRHAKAGKRATWPGPDHLRPLSVEGWAQAKALHGFLTLFGVDRVHSPALLRCVQTVRQVAEDIGVVEVEEPLLSEQGYRDDPDAAVARLRQIVTAGGTPVVCSQGGVIPDLLSRLAADSGLELREPAARKGSAWLLSFRPAPEIRLAGATYEPQP
ncbi:MAG TPA: NUDIX domain-containing protein [Actinophytocola sp.]|uniref:NUDIX hydrolase n=1 Tax=Actinophytocola sp. TaxID=1872138 RepID=UPI002DBF7A5B|nr:NUDIX domain-containing protein [Actinophytocola sp.]HEU5469054.1 NUDIX domain-containing protein [Actinophytocola sp.]